jgi:hypothetical protein
MLMTCSGIFMTCSGVLLACSDNVVTFSDIVVCFEDLRAMFGRNGGVAVSLAKKRARHVLEWGVLGFGIEAGVEKVTLDMITSQWQHLE